MKIEFDKIHNKSVSLSDLKNFKIYHKFYINQENDHDHSVYYLIKWKNKNFQKFTLEHSCLIENIIFFREEKIAQYENYKYHVKNYDSSINLSELEFSQQFCSSISDFANNENFIDKFKRSNLFVPFKNESDYSIFRDKVMLLINEIYKKVVINQSNIGEFEVTNML